MNTEAVILRLELIAAKAKQLASDLKNNKLWEGDIQSGVSEICDQARQLSIDTERR